MSLAELFILAVGVSMDAFAVAVCKGLSMKQLNWRHAVIIGVYFGGFQAGMPFIGYLLGWHFKDAITSVDHWIAFVLLAAIGLSMIRESRSKDEDEESLDASVDFKTMCVLALATSIDALAIGVTLSFLNVDIVPAVSFIGIITFSLSIVGVKAGNVFGIRFVSYSKYISCLYSHDGQGEGDDADKGHCRNDVNI